MPNINDIGKINSRIITGVGAVDAVLKGSIENIDGETVIPITVPSVAYSVRLLDTAVGVPTYTGVAMRVRRVTGAGNAGNDDEADVGFDSNNNVSLESPVSNFSTGGSNATTLGQFLNVGTVNSITYTDADSLSPNTAAAYVDEWKDQSGNGVDASQTTPASQPQIHSGTANTDLFTENGKTALDFDGSNSLPMGTFASGSLDAMSALSVCRFDTAATTPQRIAFAGRDGTSGARIYIPWITGGNFQIGWNAGNNAVFGSQDQDQHFWTAYGGTVNSYAYKDGTGGTMTNQTSSINGVGYAVGGIGAGLWLGPIQECIIWNSDQHSNRTGIETDINDYYEIIVNGEAATSGFLFDYPNAAVAYSVRQLNNNAEFSMQVERSDGRTLNVGFDVNGDLDTQAIINFAGTSVATVRKWFDQTGTQNHATQATAAAQLTIYDGAAIITANGKAALQKGGRNFGLVLSTDLALSNLCLAWAGNRSTSRNDGIMVRSGADRFYDIGTLYFEYSIDGTTVNNGTGSSYGAKMYVIDKNGSSIVNRINGSSTTVTLSGTMDISELVSQGVSTYTGEINEIVIWGSSKSSDQIAIENNINTEYGIF